jgi:hypothetical protein
MPIATPTLILEPYNHNELQRKFDCNKQNCRQERPPYTIYGAKLERIRQIEAP